MARFYLTIFLLLTWTCSQASEYAVVVSRNLQVDQMDTVKVRDIFLKKRSFDKNVRLFPVNLLGDESSRKAFESRILKMDREQINRYWVKKHFQGVTPPTTQASLNSIKKFVENVDGAIGYLPADMVDANLKVIHEF